MIMKTLLAFVMLLLMPLLVTSVNAGGFPKRVHYIDQEKTTVAMYKGGRVIEDEGLIVIANRAVQRGAEMHAKTNHVFIIVDGEAEFVTGGKLIDPKEISPGQIRAKGIEGGVSHRLVKGVVITIPANTPHWWKDTSKTGSVGYYAVNYEE
jgi:quercetin dioxygenase-like cupin family protein